MIGDQYSTAEKSTGKRILQVVVKSSLLMQFYETAKATFFSSGETKAEGGESVAEGLHLLEGQVSTSSTPMDPQNATLE